MSHAGAPTEERVPLNHLRARHNAQFPGEIHERVVTTYGNHIYWDMATMKTTVYLDAADYRRLKTLAAAEGRSAAELIRLAVSEYTQRNAPRTVPTSIGAGRSGDGCLAERSEDLLRGLGEGS